MIVYGENRLFFQYESCIDKINIHRSYPSHIKKNRIELDDENIVSLDESTFGLIRDKYKHGINTEQRTNFIRSLCKTITQICDITGAHFIKLCLPIYLFGHNKIADELQLSKSVKRCGCKNKNDNSKLEHIEIIISKEQI